MSTIGLPGPDFYKTLKMFIKCPQASLNYENGILKDLIIGWNNLNWSAHDEYLWSCIYHSLLNIKYPILECGSGLTTIITGIIAEQAGNSVWSLENSEEWSVRVQNVLKEFKINSVHLYVKPLKNYGRYYWYDPPLRFMPSKFGLVICDGPPGSTIGGRLGLVPVMRKRLTKGTLILLDDADRPGEQIISDEWTTMLGAKVKIAGIRKPYIKIHL
jgi:hypothetical protein